MAKKTFFLVWSPDKSEAFVTENDLDAAYVARGERPGFSCSAAGEAFRDAYCDGTWDDDDDNTDLEPPKQLECEQIEFEV